MINAKLANIRITLLPGNVVRVNNACDSKFDARALLIDRQKEKVHLQFNDGSSWHLAGDIIPLHQCTDNERARQLAKEAGLRNRHVRAGLRYKGGFLDGKYGGKGIVRYMDGAVASGTWIRGMLQGHGKLISTSLDELQSAWFKCKQYVHGRGKWSQLRYSGEMIDGKRDGKGILRQSNGYAYRGGWRNDFLHGKGTLRLPDKTRVRVLHVSGARVRMTK